MITTTQDGVQTECSNTCVDQFASKQHPLAESVWQTLTTVVKVSSYQLVQVTDSHQLSATAGQGKIAVLAYKRHLV